MTGLFKPQRQGKVFSYANQYVETSFFLFLLPLKSHFVNLNTKETIEIPLNKTSLKNYYISLFFVVFGILFFFLVMNLFDDINYDNGINRYLSYLPAIISGSLILSGFILGYKIGKSSKFETKKRTIFQMVVDINALPEWLSVEKARAIYTKLKDKLPQNWIDRITNKELTPDQFPLYYTMLTYENRIKPNEVNDKLLNYLEERLKNNTS